MLQVKRVFIILSQQLPRCLSRDDTFHNPLFRYSAWPSFVAVFSAFGSLLLQAASTANADKIFFISHVIICYTATKFLAQSPSVSAIENLNFERSRYSRPSRGILHFLQLCEFYERICHHDGHYSLASK